MVAVGPPLFWSGPSSGFVVTATTPAARPVLEVTRLWSPVTVPRLRTSWPPELFATIEFARVRVAPASFTMPAPSPASPAGLLGGLTTELLAMVTLTSEAVPALSIAPPKPVPMVLPRQFPWVTASVPTKVAGPTAPAGASSKKTPEITALLASAVTRNWT